MFTGLVQYLGKINSITNEPPGVRLAMHAGPLAQGAQIGDSICTNGCCLSVVQTDETLEFQLGPETLQRTNFRTCKVADPINLERSLTLQNRLDGHLVTGHVDGLGILEERIQEQDWVTCRFTCPKNLLTQLAAKGSVAIDKVSLTVVDVNETSFSVALIPHTLSQYHLGKTCCWRYRESRNRPYFQIRLPLAGNTFMKKSGRGQPKTAAKNDRIEQRQDSPPAVPETTQK